MAAVDRALRGLVVAWRTWRCLRLVRKRERVVEALARQRRRIAEARLK